MPQPRLDDAVPWHQFAPIIQRVLSKLGWRDLLRLEVVCKTWRASSASSSEQLVVRRVSSSFKHWLQANSNRILSLAVERSDGYRGNPRFPTVDTLSHLFPDPSADEVAAKQQTTWDLLEHLLSTATRLQHLHLSCRNLQEFPDNLEQLLELRSLTFRECGSLQELPASIGSLSSLTSLTISGCDELTELPESLGNLAALQELCISSCLMLLELPASIAGLAALEGLTLDGCCYLKLVDDEMFAGMESLRKLSINMCTTMKELPRSLVQASNLEELNFGFNRDLKLRWLPGQLKRFRNLHTLQISGAKVNMASLFKGMASIKGLRRAVILSVGIDKKTQEQGLPDDLFAPLARHNGLTSLELSDWRTSALPASIGQLSSLRSLTLSECSMAALPDSICSLTGVTELRLKYCSLKRLPSNIGQLVQLRMLYIDHCEWLLELPASLGQLTGISNMTVSCCRSLGVVPDEVKAMNRRDSLRYMFVCCEALGM